MNKKPKPKTNSGYGKKPKKPAPAAKNSMRRDLKLIRAILEDLEQYPEMSKSFSEIKIDGYSVREIAYHVELCRQSELIQSSGKEIILKWDGHEWLANQRMAESGITAESLTEEIKNAG